MSPTKIMLKAPEVIIDANTVTVPNGDVIASGTHLHTHLHGGVQSGGGDTGQPI